MNLLQRAEFIFCQQLLCLFENLVSVLEPLLKVDLCTS